MRCVKCGAETFSDKTTDVIEFDECILVIRNIPCRKCSECDEVIYSGKTIRELEKIVDKVKISLTDILVVDFKKIAA